MFTESHCKVVLVVLGTTLVPAATASCGKEDHDPTPLGKSGEQPPAIPTEGVQADCPQASVLLSDGICCTPSTCDSIRRTAPLSCGRIEDGCGGTIECLCEGLMTCGGGGIPYECGCAPKSCESESKNCGTIADGCGGQIASCGVCPPGLTCGGGGVANVCGLGPAAPVSCESAEVECGLVSNGVDGVINCGCPDGSSCKSGMCVACSDSRCGEVRCTRENWRLVCPERACQRVVGCDADEGECEYQPFECVQPATGCPRMTCQAERNADGDLESSCVAVNGAECTPAAAPCAEGRCNGSVCQPVPCGDCGLGQPECVASTLVCNEIAQPHPLVDELPAEAMTHSGYAVCGAISQVALHQSEARDYELRAWLLSATGVDPQRHVANSVGYALIGGVFD